MGDMWRPEIEDFIEAHSQAGTISKIRTKGFMHSRESGIEKLEKIIKDAEELEEPYELAAFYLRETVKKQPFSDGNPLVQES